jgi:alkylation response protein AidB-like acyl-CoA dehydrogenase
MTTAAATAASAIAPDTSGMNFWRDDPAVGQLLSLYVEPGLFAHLAPHLDELGGRAAGDLDEAARLADRHPPVLHHRDRFGRDVQWIEYHPAYRQLEQAAFGRYGMHAMSHRAGVLGWPGPLPAVAKHVFTLLFNEAEFGLGCPINLTDSAAHLVATYGSPALREYLLPRMLTQDLSRIWQGAQFMTEQEGGSDVGAATTLAVADGSDALGPRYRLHGQKWFCSNADAAVATLLARPAGAPAGGRGLGLFVMSRTLPDGTANGYRIVRLKDKLGTRSMASGEIHLHGAIAYPLGDLSAGLRQMMSMVNWSRLSNGIKSAALMRRSVLDAWQVMRHRQVFGQPLLALPLAVRQMLKVQLPAEEALSVGFFVADALDRAGGGAARGDNAAAAVVRLGTPLLKFRATRDARRVTGDAMEIRGGCGYVEDFANARLVRDAHLGSIWEGTTNVVAIDALRRAVGRQGCLDAWVAALDARLDACRTAPGRLRDGARQALHAAAALVQRTVRDGRELLYRRTGSTLYHATAAALMVWEGERLLATHGDCRRWLWARSVLDERLSADDPLSPRGDAERERRMLDMVMAAHADEPAVRGWAMA